jgi:hypothetical protein
MISESGQIDNPRRNDFRMVSRHLGISFSSQSGYYVTLSREDSWILLKLFCFTI